LLANTTLSASEICYACGFNNKTKFIPLFTMAGLLCLVMAGLFHRAAEMKAENDLTI